MRRWTPWPRSMAGQLGLLLLVGALATHAIGVLFLQRWGALVHPISLDQVLERHRIAHAVLPGMAPVDSAAVLRSMEQGGSRVWTSTDADVTPHPMQSEELRIAAALRAHVGLDPNASLWVQLERMDGGPARVRLDALRNWQALQLRISVGLPGGGWLNSRQQPSGGYEWWRLLRFSLPVSILPVLVIGWLFVRRILRPLHALADAAAKLGRGERLAPLPVEGPREARALTAAFNGMQDKVFRFVQDRTRMLASIGHDFRTPITSLRLQAALVEDEDLRRDMVDTLNDMRAMVEETLDFARDDAGIEATQSVDLQALLETVAQRWRGTGSPVTVAPFASGSALYRGRPLALRRAVSNLVDNALRHGGNARLSLSGTTQGGPQSCCIDIDDDGPGIEPTLLEKVFDPFFRADKAQGEAASGGLGLGLSIARTCAQAHGGEVELINRPGGGLRARLRLP